MAWEGKLDSEPFVTWLLQEGCLEVGGWIWQPGPPPLQRVERSLPAHLPLAPARLWTCHLPHSPLLAGLDSAPDALVLTAPAETPTLFPQTGSSWLQASHPPARWKHQPDVGTVARGGGWEEVAVRGGLE